MITRRKVLTSTRSLLKSRDEGLKHEALAQVFPAEERKNHTEEILNTLHGVEEDLPIVVRQTEHSMQLILAIVCLGVVIAMVGLLYTYRKVIMQYLSGDENKRITQRDLFTCCGLLHWWNLGIKTGLKQYPVRLGPVRISDLPPGHAYFLQFKCGDNPIMVTRVHETSQVVNFSETFVMMVAAQDDDLLISLKDQGVLIKKELARCFIKSEDVIRLAKHGCKTEKLDMIPNQISLRQRRFCSLEVGFHMDEPTSEPSDFSTNTVEV